MEKTFCFLFILHIQELFYFHIIPLQIDIGKISEYVVPMSGGLNLPPNFYIILPCILTAICMPFVVTRAVMMELDCFVFEKSQLNVQKEKCVESQHQLPRILSKSFNSNDIKCRIYTALLCSILVNIVVILFLIIFGILIYITIR